MALLVGLAVVAVVWPGRDELPSVIESRFDLLTSEIYDVAQWARRLPADLALPIVARSKIRSFVGDLDLEPEVRNRVLARLESRAFVDEIIPFALALRDVYMTSEEWAPEAFDDWLRRSFDRGDDVPGFEHSMFAWDPKDDGESEGDGFDDELAAMLVSFYDSLYLQHGGPDSDLEDQLACARRDTDQSRAPAAERVRPVVRDLLAEVRSRVQAEGELAAALDGILSDPQRLQTVSISLVHFLDDFVCSHYRIFATGVLREDQLARWMLAELDKSGAGRLWSYLEWAQSQRRHAALVVVDGLQGRLVESLATGRAGAGFLREVRREQDEGTRASPMPTGAKRAPAQQTEFLRGVAETGFSDPRYLSFFRGLFEDPAGIARVGVATTPTISVRNLPIAKTGAPVAGDGATLIPNFHFVDRAAGPGGRAYYFYGNDALQLVPLARGAGMRTLFDRLPLASSFSCGAQYDAGAHYRVDALLNLALGEKVRDFGELRCMGELRRRGAAEAELRELRTELLDKRRVLGVQVGWASFLRRFGQRTERKLAEKLIRRIAELEQRAMPELLVYYNPWPDHFAHFTGPFSDEVLAPSGELNRLDHWLGLLVKIYRDAGLSDRTLLAMTGDHGLSPVFSALNPEIEIFDRLRDRGIGFRVEKISSDEGQGPKLTNPLEPPSMRGLDAVVASTAGGNYMIDLFVDQGEGWTRQPVRAELEDLELIDGSGPVNVIDEIYASLSDTLDYMVVRAGVCDVAGGEVDAIGQRDGKRSQAKIVRRGKRVFLERRGGDLLSLRKTSAYESLSEGQLDEYRALYVRCVEGAVRSDPVSWCAEEEWRLLTSYTERPDSVVQLAHLYDTDRAGTVNLFPRRGVGYNTVVPGRHAGESFHEKNAFVGVWGVPVARTTRPRSIQVGAAPATVYSYLADKPVLAGNDGFGFSAIPLRDGKVEGSTTGR